MQPINVLSYDSHFTTTSLEPFFTFGYGNMSLR